MDADTIKGRAAATAPARPHCQASSPPVPTSTATPDSRNKRTPAGTGTTRGHSPHTATTMMATAADEVSRQTEAQTTPATGSRPKGPLDAGGPTTISAPISSPGPRPANVEPPAQMTTHISFPYTTHDAQCSGSQGRQPPSSANTSSSAAPTGLPRRTAPGSTAGTNASPDSSWTTHQKRPKAGTHNVTDQRDARGQGNGAGRSHVPCHQPRGTNRGPGWSIITGVCGPTEGTTRRGYARQDRQTWKRR